MRSLAPPAGLASRLAAAVSGRPDVPPTHGARRVLPMRDERIAACAWLGGRGGPTIGALSLQLVEPSSVATDRRRRDREPVSHPDRAAAGEHR